MILDIDNALELCIPLDELAKYWEFPKDKLEKAILALHLGAQLQYPNKPEPLRLEGDLVIFNSTFLIGCTGNAFAIILDNLL